MKRKVNRKRMCLVQFEKMVVCIDGPSGSGKSTVAKFLSDCLDVHYLDTGAMYRAVAFKVLQDGVDLSIEETLKQFLNALNIQIRFLNGKQITLLDGEDITNNLRTEEISIKASDIAKLEKVRLKLVELQRKFARENGCIMDGRDIGTHVLPDAQFKFFLTADIEERVKRRQSEYLLQGRMVAIEQLASSMRKRDEQDAKRTFAPLKKATDAIEIDTTHLSPLEVRDKILKIIKGKMK